jgi:presequence protease
MEAKAALEAASEDLVLDRTSDQELEYSSIMSGQVIDPEEACFERRGRSEAWKTPSMVNYVARFGNYRKHGLDYNGALYVLRTLLNYDYLWNNIRVLGGAYGCSSLFAANGNAGFTSYRDPKLLETNDVYKNIPGYVRNYSADEREMTQAVIGAAGILDTPLTPYMKGALDLTCFLTGYTTADRQKERDDVIDCTPEKIRALAPIIEAVLSDGAMCAVGNASAIEAHEEAWDRAEALYRA